MHVDFLGSDSHNLKDKLLFILTIAASSWYLNQISARQYRFVFGCSQRLYCCDRTQLLSQAGTFGFGESVQPLFVRS